MYDIEWGKAQLKKLDPKDKYSTMITTVAVLTKLLEDRNVSPIIVGGLSVEIYTNFDYSTRDIDFLSGKIDEVTELLKELGSVLKN